MYITYTIVFLYAIFFENKWKIVKKSPDAVLFYARVLTVADRRSATLRIIHRYFSSRHYIQSRIYEQV